MGRALLCVGDYAKNPYHLEKLGRRIYSIEELCYSLKEGAFLLDKDIMDEGLADWIEEECHLPKLAKELRGFINRKGSVSVFVAVIMEYAAYCTKEEIREIELLLKKNADLTGLEKGKAYADYLLKQEKYDAALAEYGELLQGAGTEGTEEQEFIRKIYHNMGTACAGLFSFERAGAYFEKCLGMEESREDEICFLAAKRLALGEEKYIAFLADNPRFFSVSLELEKKVEHALTQWRHTGKGAEYEAYMTYKREGNMPEYYAGILNITEGIKEDYRRMTER